MIDKKQNEQMQRQQQIYNLKAQLVSQESEIGDWQINKYLEYTLVGQEIPGDSLLVLHDKRQAVRDQINALQTFE